MALRGEILFQSTFEELHIDLALLGLIYIFGKIFSIVGSMYAHKIEDCLGFKKSMTLVACLQIASFSILLFSELILTITAISIYFFSENIFRNIRDSWILYRAPLNRRASAISSVSFSTAVFALAFTPIIGLGIDQAVYWGIAILVFAKLIGFVLVFNGRLNKPNLQF